MRQIVISFALVVAAMVGAPSAAHAQTYCAVYPGGDRSCGIPTLQACQRSISGAGGSCQIDQGAHLRPNLIDRLEGGRRNRPAPDQQPGGLNWMPPPPGQ